MVFEIISLLGLYLITIGFIILLFKITIEEDDFKVFLVSSITLILMTTLYFASKENLMMVSFAITFGIYGGTFKFEDE